MENRKLYQGLALVGTLAFIACAAASMAGVVSLAPLGALDVLAILVAR